MDGSLVAVGTTYKPPTTLSVGTHTVTVRAYDYEGIARQNTNREDIDGKTVRTLGYGSAQTPFTITSAVASSENVPTSVAVAEIPVELLEAADFDSSKSFDFSGIHQDVSSNRKSLRMNVLTIDDNTDLYIIGSVAGAVNSINILNVYGETVASVEGIYSSEYTVIKNIPAGEYTLQIDAVDSSQQIPYSVYISAVPAVPEVSVPKSIGGINTMEIYNPYSNLLKVVVNQREYSVLPNETKEIHFEEGENRLVYYSENEYGKSEMVEKVVYCDTIAPVVELKKAVSDGEILVITGQISEFADHLYINNEHICLGEWYDKDEPITFTYILTDTNTSVLNIEAIDAYGNNFTASVNLQW